MSNALVAQVIELEDNGIRSRRSRMHGCVAKYSTRNVVRSSRERLRLHLGRLVDVPLAVREVVLACRRPSDRVGRTSRAGLGRLTAPGELVGPLDLAAPVAPPWFDLHQTRTYVRMSAGRKRARLGAPRGVAQSGSASGWGPEGRRFKSCLPDLGSTCRSTHFDLLYGGVHMRRGPKRGPKCVGNSTVGASTGTTVTGSIGAIVGTIVTGGASAASGSAVSGSTGVKGPTGVGGSPGAASDGSTIATVSVSSPAATGSAASSVAATNGQSATSVGAVTGSTTDRAHALLAASAGSLMRALPSVAAGGLLRLAQSLAASAGAAGAAAPAPAAAGSAVSGGNSSLGRSTRGLATTPRTPPQSRATARSDASRGLLGDDAFE